MLFARINKGCPNAIVAEEGINPLDGGDWIQKQQIPCIGPQRFSTQASSRRT